MVPVSEYARFHPEDPDLPEIVERADKERSLYLRWGRETLGWAIYVFRRDLGRRHWSPNSIDPAGGRKMASHLRRYYKDASTPEPPGA
jgi:hypothetical protein